MTARRYLWTTNNFLHDLATGVWAACILVVWLLSARLGGIPPAAADALLDAMRTLRDLAIVALVVIGATGGVRVGYWRRQSEPEDVAHKRRALIVKHVLLLVVYGAGTWWLTTLVR
jgi:putative copper export protein